MRFEDRAALIEEFVERNCKPLMAAKGAEYSRGEEDCNSNFKRVAESTGLDPIQVAYVYLAKHLDSISNFVKTKQTPSGEPIEGRIADAVNYLFILYSLIEGERPRSSA